MLGVGAASEPQQLVENAAFGSERACPLPRTLQALALSQMRGFLDVPL